MRQDKQPTCRECNEPVLWFKTRNNKNVPVNITEKSKADHAAKLVFNTRDHQAHWKTCKNAAPHHRENRGER
jgi:hypothetical protein